MCPPPALLKTPGKSFCPALGMFISHLSATPEEQNVIMALKAGKTLTDSAGFGRRGPCLAERTRDSFCNANQQAG